MPRSIQPILPNNRLLNVLLRSSPFNASTQSLSVIEFVATIFAAALLTAGFSDLFSSTALAAPSAASTRGLALATEAVLSDFAMLSHF